MWLIYELLYCLGFLLYLPSALWRRRFPHPGWSMRVGSYPREIRQRLSQRSTIWLHAVSVGETLAAQPLVRALMQQDPQQLLVLSAVTPGGFAVTSKLVESRGVAIYFPLDFRWTVRRALEVMHPRMFLLMESELWPTMLRLTHARGIPIIVINGRISDHAYQRYRWVRPWALRLFEYVTLFLMQSQADADRLLALGVPAQKVHVVGNLKWDASLTIRPSIVDIHATTTRLGVHYQDVVIVGGSTHRGEEQVLLQAYRALRASHESLRLILAPRHLERLEEVERLVGDIGLTSVRLSLAAEDGRWDVGLVDTFGQLPRYYGVATIVFIGGSLIPHGGQNPLEAASLGKPILFGPSMENFSAIAHQLLAHHAARQVGRGEEVTAVLQELLTHPQQAQAMGHNAQALTEQFQGATQRTLELLTPFLGHHVDWPKGYG